MLISTKFKTEAWESLWSWLAFHVLILITNKKNTNVFYTLLRVKNLYSFEPIKTFKKKKEKGVIFFISSFPTVLHLVSQFFFLFFGSKVQFMFILADFSPYFAWLNCVRHNFYLIKARLKFQFILQPLFPSFLAPLN